MPALFDLLESEAEPSVRAVLGHWLVGCIHPYPDGSGRIARFLMNVMLASGGYPWTVIRVEDRNAYMAALEAASVETDIRLFARFLADRLRWSMEAAEEEGRILQAWRGAPDVLQRPPKAPAGGAARADARGSAVP